MKLPRELASYDPKFTYLGPNGHWSKKFIPKTPIGIPELFEDWNKAAWRHDIGYFGSKQSSLYSWWSPKKYYWIWRERRQRRKIDDQFRLDLEAGVVAAQSELRPEQFERAMEYAKDCYEAVRLGGWMFYRPSVVALVILQLCISCVQIQVNLGSPVNNITVNKAQYGENEMTGASLEDVARDLSQEGKADIKGTP